MYILMRDYWLLDWHRLQTGHQKIFIRYSVRNLCRLKSKGASYFWSVTLTGALMYLPFQWGGLTSLLWLFYNMNNRYLLNSNLSIGFGLFRRLRVNFWGSNMSCNAHFLILSCGPFSLLHDIISHDLRVEAYFCTPITRSHGAGNKF